MTRRAKRILVIDADTEPISIRRSSPAEPESKSALSPSPAGSKPDISAITLDIFQLKKLLADYAAQLNIDLSAVTDNTAQAYAQAHAVEKPKTVSVQDLLTYEELKALPIPLGEIAQTQTDVAAKLKPILQAAMAQASSQVHEKLKAKWSYAALQDLLSQHQLADAATVICELPLADSQPPGLQVGQRVYMGSDGYIHPYNLEYPPPADTPLLLVMQFAPGTGQVVVQPEHHPPPAASSLTPVYLNKPQPEDIKAWAEMSNVLGPYNEQCGGITKEILAAAFKVLKQQGG